MTKAEMQNEIETLHAQVALLTAERKSHEKKQASSSQESEKESVAQGTTASESSADEEDAAKSEESDLTSQFQELIESIDQELKDASPVTVLIVFALGVFVGRLLPK